jgi:PAS domain S-box-containing protein
VKVADTIELLNALPGPAWVVDCFLLRVTQRNAAAGAISLENEYLSCFDQELNPGLITRLRENEPQISFHAYLKGDTRLHLLSATLIRAESGMLRLLLAQPAALLDVAAEVTFDELLDSAFDGLVVLNSDHRIVQISKHFQKMFGYTLDELRGKTPQVLVPPELSHEYEAAVNTLERGGIYQIETRRRCSDGTQLEVQVSSQSIASGRFRGGLVLIYRDITAINRDKRYRNLRLETRRILARSATLQEAASDLLPAIADALDWDVSRLWTPGENSMECFHSFSKTDCSCGNVGKPGTECVLNIEAAAKGLTSRADHFETVGGCAKNSGCKLRDGTQVVVPILDSHRQVLGVLELVTSRRLQRERARRDLLEGLCVYLGQFIIRLRAEQALQENEAKFRTLAETIPTAVFIHSDGVIIYANPACEALCGFSAAEFMGQPVWPLFHRDDVEELKDRAARRQRGEGFAHGSEVRLIRKNGDLRWVNYSASRIMMNKRPAVVCAATDITERRELEAQLRQTQKMEAIGRLAGGIAHDFNNLLSVVSCCAEMINMNEGLPAEVLRSSSEISNAADRAAALTRQLLSFSRHKVVAPRLLDLNSVLSGTELILRRSLGDDIVLHFNFEPGLGMVLADASQIEQVVMNLAVNGRDAMPDGGELTISTMAVTLDGSTPEAAKAGCYLMLSVSDTGTGMSQEILQHIFEPFFTTKQATKGTGLGLSTVYGIVEQTGGFIRVESTPDRGTTFHVFFPVAQGEAMESKDPAPDQAAIIQSATILLVEDEDDVRGILRSSLVNDGHIVLEAFSASEAMHVSAAHEGKIDLLMTDVVMPGISGRELADRLLPTRKGMKVLYISGYNEDTVLQKGVIDGQMEFLQKPFSLAVLRRKVWQMLSV